MSADRRKKRMIDANGKELYKLVVDYLFSIQNKTYKEVKEIRADRNQRWVKKCKSFNKAVITPNPNGFKDCITNKAFVKTIQKDLGLDKPNINWFQRIFG